MHDFTTSLAESHAAADWPGWEYIYRKAWLDVECLVDHRQDGWHQRAGVDRSVVLRDSRQFRIDEKVRKRNAKTGLVYSDIALEFLSDVGRGVPGWVCKPLLSDFIAYAILPLGKCYLLPIPQLQKAWSEHGDQWKHNYGPASGGHWIDAPNKGYVTRSVGVPVPEVFRAIGDTLRVDFAPCEDVVESAPTWPVDEIQARLL